MSVSGTKQSLKIIAVKATTAMLLCKVLSQTCDARLWELFGDLVDNARVIVHILHLRRKFHKVPRGRYERTRNKSQNATISALFMGKGTVTDLQRAKEDGC